jgi:hypothetical protein
MIDFLADKFYTDLVKTEDQSFLDLIFSENPSQKALDELLQIWDIEAKGSTSSLMLSYLMKEHPELKFNDYEAPRLKGLIDFHKFSNLKTLSYFSKVGKELNKAGITPMILKGAAIKALRPELARPMADVDFLVRTNEYEQAIEIARKCGFDGSCARHSIDMTHRDGVGALDIHNFIKMDDLGAKQAAKFADRLNAGFYSRAKNINAFGVNCLIPSNEDLMFITLTNLGKNLTAKQSVRNILFALFDLKYFISDKNFDWDIVFENINTANARPVVKIAAEFIERIVPGMLPQVLCEEISSVSEVKKYYQRVTYDICYYHNFRQACHDLLFKDVLKSPWLLPKYSLMRIKYQLMRFIRKRPVLVDLYLGGAHAYR